MKTEQLIYERISQLSSGQKKVAEYILQNLESFSYSTLAKLSKEISVSETTIIRLSYALGFDSFSALQQKVRQEILSQPTPPPEERLLSTNFYQSIVSKEISSLQEWMIHLDKEQLDRVIKQLLQADKILVVGSRSSYSAALWFGDALRRMLDHIETVSESHESRFDFLSDITERTVIICITFARYSKWTYRYSQTAKKRGAQVITITDSIVSPVIPFSDEAIIINSNKNKMGFNSFVCMYCLFNALIAKLQSEKNTEIPSKIKELEQIYSDFDLFFE